MTDQEIADSLSEAGKSALLWLYGPYKGKPQWRSYSSPICGDPAHAAFSALMRKGLVEKWGGNGCPIKYQPSETGLRVRAILEKQNG